MFKSKLLLVVCTIGGLFLVSPQASADCWYTYSSGGSCVCVGGATVGYLNCQSGSPTCNYSGECGYAFEDGCFVGGTMLLTEDGYVPIEEVSVGDFVLGLGEGPDGKQGLHEVMETYRVIRSEYYEINGHLRVTAEHPFWDGSGWKEAQHLRVGDVLASLDGSSVTVLSVKPIAKAVRAYNINVSGNHTFFAGDILVHNKN